MHSFRRWTQCLWRGTAIYRRHEGEVKPGSPSFLSRSNGHESQALVQGLVTRLLTTYQGSGAVLGVGVTVVKETKSRHKGPEAPCLGNSEAEGVAGAKQSWTQEQGTEVGGQERLSGSSCDVDFCGGVLQRQGQSRVHPQLGSARSCFPNQGWVPDPFQWGPAEAAPRPC